MSDETGFPPEDRPSTTDTSLRVIMLAEALSAWLFVGLSAWFYFQPEGGPLLSGVLAAVALIDPPVMGIVVRQIRSRNAAQSSSDGLPPPPGSVPGDLQTSLSLTIGAVVLGVGLAVFLAILDATRSPFVMVPLVALWALGALSALIYTLTALRHVFGGAAA